MHRSLYALMLGMTWLGSASTAPGAAIVTVDLGTPTVTSSAAVFDVRFLFTGAAGDQIEAIQLSVLGSSPALTQNGTDFSRFGFALDPVTLSGWQELFPIGVGGVGLYGPADPIAGPFLPPGAMPAQIGQLTVNLQGLSGGTSLLVTLAGGPLGQNTDTGGSVDGMLILSFADDPTGSASLNFAQPNGVIFATPQVNGVPEPGTWLLFAAGALGLCAMRRLRDWPSLSTR